MSNKFITGVLAAAIALSAYSCAPNIQNATVGGYIPTNEAYSYAPDGSLGMTFSCAGDHSIHDRIVADRNSVERTVLETTPGAWDSAHVCDPDVTFGDFSLNGVDYNWAMVYTGTRDPYSNGTHNSVGIAFSNNRTDWVKRADPLMKNRCDPADRGCWGIGQPWIVSVDGGEVLMGVTGAGREGHLVRHLDLSEVTDFGAIEQLGRWSPSTAGLNPVAHQPLPNAAFAYEPERDRFWVVRASHFSWEIVPTFIAEQVEVAWMPAADFWAGTGTWTSIGGVDIETTGKLKNHNAGFRTDQYGHVTPNFTLLVTTSHAQTWPEALFEYRVLEIEVAS